MKKLTTKDFIEKAKIVHNDYYDYSLVTYVNTRTKIAIICPKHGKFLQTPNCHLMGQGCKHCNNFSKLENRRALEEKKFINVSKNLNLNYDYSNVKYINSFTDVEIVCPEHGSFWQKPLNHLNGTKCPKCTSKKHDTSWFINETKKVYGDTYDLSKSNYVNTRTKLEVICSIHGSFFVLPFNFLRHNQSCPKCKKRHKLDTEEFISKASIIHNNKYNYDKVYFKTVKDKVLINCCKHGDFWQEPREHLRGRGCPSCKESKGEQKIMEILNALNISFEQQKTFEGLVYKLPLKFDFYIKSLNTVIEYNGKQHYFPIAIWGGQSALEINQIRDTIKKGYCRNQKINMIIIRYDESISSKLECLKELKIENTFIV